MNHATLSSTQRENDLARELRGRIESGELELPVLSNTANRVASMCIAGVADARELADALNHDPALAGHVLRVANSARFAPAEPIVSLQQAVSRMGLKTVGEIAFAIAVGSRVFHAPGHDDWVREMWRHAALTAAWAREIARTRRASVEGAFVCGLLHDVGEPVLLQAAVDLLARSKAKASRIELAPIVDDLHTIAGAALARAWKMAPWMVDAIADHHRAGYTSSCQEATIVRLADDLAIWTVEGLDDLSERATERLRGAEMLEQLNLYEEDVLELLSRAKTVNAFAGAMQ